MNEITPQYHYSLLSRNTFGIDAAAHCFIEYTSEEGLLQAIAFHRHEWPRLPLLHIGGGSNLLFMHDFPGTILHSAIHGVQLMAQEEDMVLVRVGAGMKWDEWVEYSLSRGWYGMENLSLIPGEVGASAVQNIGAYGAEAAQYIEKVECVDLTDGSLRTFDVAECEYGYRHSVFKTKFQGRYAVTHVWFRLSLAFAPNLSYHGLTAALEAQGKPSASLTAQDIRQTVISVRRKKLPDPEQLGNAGSFFMNPVVPVSLYNRLKESHATIPCYRVDDDNVKIPAAWLIEQCGWKGRSLGKAAVHARQPLVLVNAGGASGQDIMELCRCVQADVRERFGIALQPEVMILSNFCI